MKTIIVLIITLCAFSISHAQEKIPSAEKNSACSITKKTEKLIAEYQRRTILYQKGVRRQGISPDHINNLGLRIQEMLKTCNCSNTKTQLESISGFTTKSLKQQFRDYIIKPAKKHVS
ncbi:hypothetical protein CL684_01685 [Candidatus Campbellbacteria bacterium]|nr:hypothetical protein [Candidatus Campbellbacteria bacterium]|tara:strand:+ start:316 stop:669 length:354 start_codon:yes stop_codon:yes gene_type:complete